MTKRILIGIAVIIFCFTKSMAQDITKSDYEKLVDYVNVFYMQKYVDKRIKEGDRIFTSGYITDYNNRVRKAWNNAISDNNPPQYNSILKALGGHPNATSLCKYINEKKNNFNGNLGKEGIINGLLFLSDESPNFKEYLKSETNQLKDLLNKLMSNNPDTNDNASSDNNGNDSNNQARGSRNQSTEPYSGKVDEKSNSYLSILLKIIYIIITCGLCFLLFNYRKQIKYFWNKFKPSDSTSNNTNEIENIRKQLKELKLENKGLKYLENDNSSLRTEKKQLEQKNRELEKKCQELEKGIQGLTNIENSQKHIISETRQVEPKPIQRFCFYADSIINGVFNKISETPNEDTIFELKKTSSAHIAQICIYQEAIKRVIKNPDFVEGCDKQKISLQPQSIEVEAGEATCEEGKWKINKKVKIRFI